MQKSVLGIALLSAGVFAAGLLTGQAAAPKAAPAEKQQKLVRVSTLNTIEANREFQSNVQVLQAQRQLAVELNAAVEKEKDAAKKKELKGQLDTLMAKLNENNRTMLKTYGFSLERNYTLVVVRAHIYMFVTDEEAANFEKAEAERLKAEKSKK